MVKKSVKKAARKVGMTIAAGKVAILLRIPETMNKVIVRMARNKRQRGGVLSRQEMIVRLLETHPKLAQ